MIKEKIKKKFDEDPTFYISLTVGAMAGACFILGTKYQKKVDIKSIAKNLDGVRMLGKATETFEAMFPITMPISEIKTVVANIPGAEWIDALIVTIGNEQHLITRS